MDAEKHNFRIYIYGNNQDLNNKQMSGANHGGQNTPFRNHS